MIQQDKINVDKLYISYRQNDYLAEEMAKLSKGEVFYGDGFELTVTNKKASTIYAKLTGNGYNFGQFVINENSIVFEYDNEILYTEFGKGFNGQKYSFQVVGEAITNYLGLEPLNVTNLELAIDSNKCPQVRAVIADTEYDMFFNGKRVKEGETIPNYFEVFGRSRKALQRNPTIYFGQARKDGVKFKLYDKVREIEQVSEKDYIKDWNDFNNGGIYRLEMTIGSKQWQEWLEFAKVHLRNDYNLMPNETTEEYNARNIYYLSCDEAYKVALWNWMADRVLYFVDKKTKEKITLFDLCTGWKKPQHNKKKS